MVANFRNFTESLLKFEGSSSQSLSSGIMFSCEILSFNFRRQISYLALWLQRRIENTNPRTREQLVRARNVLLLKSYTW